MSLKDVFIIREGSVKASDWNIDPSAQGMVDAFYEKYSQAVILPSGERGPIAGFFLFIDDWMGNGSLADAIGAGDWQQIEQIVKDISAEYPDPAAFDIAASAGMGSDIPGKMEPKLPKKQWMN